MSHLNLDDLIERARQHKMTPDELDEQIVSFAYGNVAMHNPDVTLESVRRAHNKLRGRLCLKEVANLNGCCVLNKDHEGECAAARRYPNATGRPAHQQFKDIQ